ncbi:MAG TPA: YcbK family protein [Candidatus Binataceae bacterium]|nr:YcbK family protein [Candidatus Binataceae bacterium]
MGRFGLGAVGARPLDERTGTLNRRQLLKIGTVVAGSALVPGAALAALRVPYPPERSLKIYNLHTGETLTAQYCENGCYVEGALSEINYIMRDFRANEIKPIDPHLLDLLYSLNRRLATQEPFHLISGYRSPATNAMLAARSEGVAHRSLHIEGKAADIRVPGRRLWEVWQTSMAMLAGGVGFYPRSDFVHVDVGRVRFW